MTNLTIELNSVIDMTEEQFFQLCQKNPDLRFERNAKGDLIIMSPTGGETGNRNGRLTQKLFNRVVFFTFFGQPNDIAVKVDSIKSVNSERTYPPQIQEVACDHMVYFYHPEGLQGLSQAITKAWQTYSSFHA